MFGSHERVEDFYIALGDFFRKKSSKFVHAQICLFFHSLTLISFETFLSNMQKCNCHGKRD